MATNQPDLGNLIKPFITSMAAKATTALGAFLLTSAPTGLLTSDQSSQIASAVVGIGLLAGSVVWSWARVKFAALKLNAAAATGDPAADPKALSSQVAIASAIADPSSPITAKVAS